jgi:hypothetical protein
VAHGRTYWYSEDASYVHRGRIVALGEELGMAVLAVMQVLKGEAKLQNDGGCVMSAVPTVSRNGFIKDVVLTRMVIERASERGEIDDLEWLDDIRFRCRISGWQADQERAAAATRKVRSREGSESRSVTVCHAESRDVPLQDRTGQDSDSLRSSSNAQAEQVSELFAYWRQQCGHAHAKLSPGRRRKIAGRLREGFTPQQIREAIDGAAVGAFVGDTGKRFDDVELICRSAEKLESFIGRKANEGGESPSELLRAMGAA